MKGLIDWFFRRQLMLAFAVAVLSNVLTIAKSDFSVGIFINSIVAVGMIYFGALLFADESSENWLDFAWWSVARQIIGGVLLLFGWISLLRGILGRAIGNFLAT